MLRALKVLCILSILINSFAHATSTVSESQAKLRAKLRAKNSRAICEVTAKFLKPLSVNDRVYWKFEIESARPKNAGTCPSETVFLNVYILSAEYVSKISEYVYPNYVHEPKKNQKYLIQVEKDPVRSEWMISDWTDGVRAIP
jgi:hypothetical protein